MFRSCELNSDNFVLNNPSKYRPTINIKGLRAFLTTCTIGIAFWLSLIPNKMVNEPINVYTTTFPRANEKAAVKHSFLLLIFWVNKPKALKFVDSWQGAVEEPITRECGADVTDLTNKDSKDYSTDRAMRTID